MEKGYSPYFYKWHPADGELLLDPNDKPERLANGNTVTPASFYVSYPLTFLTYPHIRTVWTILLLTGAAVTVWIMLKKYEGTSPLFPAGIVILGLLSSEYWFHMLERGQITIFYSLFFACMFYAYREKSKYAEYISGFIGGLFIFFRPFAVFIGLGFLIHGKMKWVKGSIAGVLTGFILFVAPNPSVWKDYFKAMEEYGNECQNKGHVIRDAPLYLHPATIEGTTNLTVVHDFNLTSMQTISLYMIKAGINYTPFLSYLVCGIIFILSSIPFYYLRKQSSPVKLFLFGYLMYMVAELFLLNWRNPYNIIEWIFPLFLIAQQVEKKQTLMLLLFIALLFLHNFPFPFHYQTLLGELILISLVCYIIFSDLRIRKEIGNRTDSLFK